MKTCAITRTENYPLRPDLSDYSVGALGYPRSTGALQQCGALFSPQTNSRAAVLTGDCGAAFIQGNECHRPSQLINHRLHCFLVGTRAPSLCTSAVEGSEKSDGLLFPARRKTSLCSNDWSKRKVPLNEGSAKQRATCNCGISYAKSANLSRKKTACLASGPATGLTSKAQALHPIRASVWTMFGKFRRQRSHRRFHLRTKLPFAQPASLADHNNDR